MNLEPLYVTVEQAVDAHPRLRRVPGILGEPEVRVSRLGWSVLIPVTLAGSRKKATTINGDGETLEAAAERLIAGLDNWAEAIA